MKLKLPLFFILGITVVVGLLHFAGVYFYFYWRLPGFDKLVHVVAGFLMTFICFVIIYLKRMPSVPWPHLVLFGIGAAIIIGLAWEGFELTSGITSFNQPNYFFDNGGDIAADIIGGLLAIGYFIRTYKPEKPLS